MDAEHYQEARPFMITTFERGVQERREMALLLLGEKFAPLSPEVQQRVMEMNADQLRQVIAKILKASSLEELLHG